MATKVKPCRIKATGTPQAGYVPKYVDEDTFQWGAGGGGGSDIEYKTQAEYTALLPGAESDGKHYFIYTSSQSGWQPGVNTVAYYPLDTDFNDASGNSRNLTNTNATITTLNGVDCAYYNGSAYTQYQGYALENTARTVSARFYVASGNGGAILYNGTYSNVDNPGCLGVYANSNQNVEVTDWMTSYNTGAYTPGRWNLLTVTQAGADEILYINGVQASTTSSYNSETNTPDGWCLGAKFYSNHSERLTGYLSNVILEDKVRTAQEVSDYFDLTKGDYGIS